MSEPRRSPRFKSLANSNSDKRSHASGNVSKPRARKAARKLEFSPEEQSGSDEEQSDSGTEQSDSTDNNRSSMKSKSFNKGKKKAKVGNAKKGKSAKKGSIAKKGSNAKKEKKRRFRPIRDIKHLIYITTMVQ